jgi:hypothetical protein
MTINITKTYKHGSEDFIDEIDSELKEISSRLGIGDRIERMKKREAFISLKDHKENFENNPNCRLINPAKSESGKLSKVITRWGTLCPGEYRFRHAFLVDRQ